jgi:hypothetical protein
VQELGIVAITLRDNRNPLAVWPHTIEVTTVRLSGKYEFADATGGCRTLKIAPGRRTYTVDFGPVVGRMGEPAIVRVSLQATRVDTMTVRCGSDDERHAWIKALGIGGAMVPSKWAAQVYATRELSRLGGGATMGWLAQKSSKGWQRAWFEYRPPQLSCHANPGTEPLATVSAKN